ncbi:MAG: hypothetical protein Q9187_000890 [Circinaria calcarea]
MLTTKGLCGCFVAAIVAPTGAMAAHIPHGKMVQQNGQRVQTVTADQQATLQMRELMTYYNTHKALVPHAKAVLVQMNGASNSATAIIKNALEGAGLSVTPYVYANVEYGKGVFTIDGSNTQDRYYPTMRLDVHDVPLR